MGTLRDLQFALQLKIEELRQRDTLIDELELELDTKDELIRRLQEELDRYRATVSLPACSAQGEDSPPANRETVISESVRLELSAAYSKTWDKSQESQRLIQDAFLKNELLRNLDEGEARDVIGCMYPYAVHQGCCVVQEGSCGAQAYVVEEGRLHVTKDGLKVLTLDVGDLFGEAALLYPCSHAFSVSAQDDCKLWVIDRRSYQSALMQSGLSSLSRSLKLLRSVPCLQSLPEDVIIKMSDLMEEIHYSEGDYIIRQGASGDTFYIISNGQVNVTEKRTGLEEQLVQRLSERQWFGEKALWGEDVRTVSVIAAGEVTCLVIDRETFKDILGGLVFDSGHEAPQNTVPKDESEKDAALLSSSTLSDFQIICSLGVGKFGHVDLVQLRSDVKSLFAMRVLTKKLILQSGQREHILREQSILMEAHCPFIVRLHKTFRDAECLYMLMEAGLCGDLYTLLKDKGSLDEGGAKFYTACVAEALTFLHSRNLVYRDVKPENVVLDERGYAKLTGSRCAKRVEAGKKTYTFCGTPAYVAPEIILCKGHGTSADLWSLGVFLFELLSGGLPFSGNDTVGTMSAAVRGIDQIDFPKTISKSACSLIKKLCRRNPAERLGSQRNGAKDIQKHKWFEGFNWDGLCRGTLKPALIPKVTHDVASGSCGYYSGDAAELCATWEDF